MQAKLKHFSILCILTRLCLYFGRLRYCYAYARVCAYVVVKARLAVDIKPTSTDECVLLEFLLTTPRKCQVSHVCLKRIKNS